MAVLRPVLSHCVHIVIHLHYQQQSSTLEDRGHELSIWLTQLFDSTRTR